MTAFGAWLAAIPLMIALGVGLESVVRHGPGAYVVAAIVLVVAVLLIRMRGVALFVEQLAVPCLLVGGGLLGYALYRDYSDADGFLAAVPGMPGGGRRLAARLAARAAGPGRLRLAGAGHRR